MLHTLVVDPERGGHGYGTAFVKFYEEYARENHCPYLRMDTNALNTPARRLYNHLGYEECDIVPCSFNGIDGVNLVCLEKGAEIFRKEYVSAKAVCGFGFFVWRKMRYLANQEK